MNRPSLSGEPLTVAMAYTYGGTNPYVRLLQKALYSVDVDCVPFRISDVLRKRVDIVHLQWPESAAKGKLSRALWSSSKLLAVVLLTRLLRVGLVWTVHNVRNHESTHPRLDGLVTQLLARWIDAWIALSEGAARVATDLLPELSGTPRFVVPHGHYRDAYGQPEDKGTARESLGIPGDAVVYLFFGKVRPYKNVPGLIRAFKQVNSGDGYLVIAGEGEVEELVSADVPLTDVGSRVRLLHRRIPDAEVPTLFGAADICVLPFDRVLNSGSAILALSMDTPVLIPALESLSDLQISLGEPWVQVYSGELDGDTLSSAMECALRAHGKPNLTFLSWDTVSNGTLTVYESVLEKKASRDVGQEA